MIFNNVLTRVGGLSSRSINYLLYIAAIYATTNMIISFSLSEDNSLD